MWLDYRERGSLLFQARERDREEIGLLESRAVSCCRSESLLSVAIAEGEACEVSWLEQEMEGGACYRAGLPSLKKKCKVLVFIG